MVRWFICPFQSVYVPGEVGAAATAVLVKLAKVNARYAVKEPKRLIFIGDGVSETHQDSQNSYFKSVAEIGTSWSAPS